MAHTVLARKWRPKKFIDLVGQKSTVTILQNIISSNRLHHAYLLTGTRGVGKTTIARIIAKALNCLSPEQNEPCGKCQNCQQIDTGRFVDVIEIDAASNTGVDNIREVLENAQYAPTSGHYKIYIIDEVHMLSKSAFNAMLKTLEEPPAHVVFILATTDPQKVPITVLSRCLQLKLRNLLPEEIKLHLANVLNAEGYSFETNALELLSSAANGSMRDALSLTDQAIAFGNGHIATTVVQQMLGVSDYKSIIEILDSIATNNSNNLVQMCQRLNAEGANLENILEQINDALFKIGLAQLSVQEDTPAAYQDLARKISLQDCQLYFEISNIGLEQIRKVNNKYPILTMTLLRMVAFTIGSSDYKQIIVQSNNCYSDVVVNNSEKQVSTLENDINTQTINIQEASPENDPINSIAEDIRHETETTNVQDLENEEISPPEIMVSDSTSELPPWEETNEIPNAANAIDDHKLINEQTVDVVSQPDSYKHEVKEFISWLEFVKHLNIEELPSNVGVVVNNAAQIGSISNDELKLQLNDHYRRWVDASCVDYIEKLLFENFHKHFDISFDFTIEANEGSRKEYTKSVAEKKQLEAEESIKNDPIIQDLINTFSAKIMPNSIKPL